MKTRYNRYNRVKLLPAGIVLLLLAPFLFQCVTANAANRSELEKRVDKLALANAELQSRVDELERKIKLLETTLKPTPLPKVAAHPALGETSPDSPATSPDGATEIPPPPHLLVLKLSPPNAPAVNPLPPVEPGVSGLGDTNALPLFADDPGFIDAPPGAIGNPVPPPPVVSHGEGISVEAATLYESALGQYQKGELELAAEAFELYLTKYPVNAYAPNAIFYLGECFYAKHRYQKGMEQYRRLMMKFPESDMAPEALFKMGMCFIMLNDEKSGKQAFNRVVEVYPFSEAARSAESQLKKLKKMQ